MFSVGGWSSGSPSKSIETYDPRADIWQLFEPTDISPRAYHGCICIDHFIYVIGGFGINIGITNKQKTFFSSELFFNKDRFKYYSS